MGAVAEREESRSRDRLAAPTQGREPPPPDATPTAGAAAANVVAVPPEARGISADGGASTGRKTTLSKGWGRQRHGHKVHRGVKKWRQKAGEGEGGQRQRDGAESGGRARQRRGSKGGAAHQQLHGGAAGGVGARKPLAPTARAAWRRLQGGRVGAGGGGAGATASTGVAAAATCRGRPLWDGRTDGDGAKGGRMMTGGGGGNDSGASGAGRGGGGGQA